MKLFFSFCLVISCAVVAIKATNTIYTSYGDFSTAAYAAELSDAANVADSLDSRFSSVAGSQWQVDFIAPSGPGDTITLRYAGGSESPYSEDYASARLNIIFRGGNLCPPGSSIVMTNVEDAQNPVNVATYTC